MNRKLYLVFVSCTALLAVAGLFFALTAAQAQAEPVTQTVIMVDTLDDELNSDGDCSLREAITAANENTTTDACPAGDGVITDTITFDVAGIITVTSQLSVTAGGTLVIDGGDEITISGGDSVRIFYVSAGADLSLEKLALVNGYAGDGGGGGIANEGTLNITDSTLSGNSARDGGGIVNVGTLTIANSTLSGNSSEYGGGIWNDGTLIIANSSLSGNGAYDGGGIWNGNGATLTITNSTLTGNSAGHGGGIKNNDGGDLTIFNTSLSDNSAGIGGGIDNDGSLTITNSTLSGNGGGVYGGGLSNHGFVEVMGSTIHGNIVHPGIYCGIGGGVYNWGVMTVTNSTLTGNGAYGAECPSSGGGIWNGGTLTLINNTVSGNTVGGNPDVNGGGISNTGVLTATNTIVANNAYGDCAGTIVDGGHNISSDVSCGFDPANGSLPDTDPLLGPLQDNGGPTWTHALLVGSPAIEAGDNAACPLTDQRGIPRPLDGNHDGQFICDIGSFEVEEGIGLHPIYQSASGMPGATVEYTLELFNFTSLTDTYTLALGTHAWETVLSTDLVGPLTPGSSQTFTALVTIPADAPWYLTDTAVITATSVTSPTAYSTIAQVTTQAYAPPQLSVAPTSLSSAQYTDEVTTQTLTIGNGFGVTLTFDIHNSLTDSLLLLHLDEPEGATSFYDASGNSNHGACGGTTCPSAGLPGRFGNAVYFDGVDDFIEVLDAPSLNPQYAIAISAWIHAEDWNGNRRILQKGIYDNQYRFLDEGDAFHLDIASVGRVTTDLPTPGAWHHVVGMYGDKQMQLWIDDELVAEQYAGGLIPLTTDALYVGTKYPGSWVGDYFYGLLDDIVIFDRLLSSGEIRMLYTGAYADVTWLTIDPISGTLPTNGSIPIQVTFDATDLQPDNYNTTLLINSNDPLNPVVQVPVTLTVLAPGAPLSVEIAGLQEGLAGVTYSFSAAVEPVSTTLPLTYTWQASGQEPVTHTSGITDTVDFTWQLPGTQHITVTAANSVATVSDTHTIIISDAPISGLVASNDSPTQLGSVTTLSATIQAGTNVVYAWDFGDDTGGSGAVVTHTYLAAGVYTTTVSASNSASQVSAGTVVTIITAPPPAYTINFPLMLKAPSETEGSLHQPWLDLAGLVALLFLSHRERNKKVRGEWG